MDGTSDKLGTVVGPVLGNCEGISLGLSDGADDESSDGDILGELLGCSTRVTLSQTSSKSIITPSMILSRFPNKCVSCFVGIALGKSFINLRF